MSQTNLFKELNAIADSKFTKDTPEHKELWLMLYQAAQAGIKSIEHKIKVFYDIEPEPVKPTISANRVIAYVVADNNGTVHGVRLVEAEANKLREDKQLALEMSGSRCTAYVRKFTT